MLKLYHDPLSFNSRRVWVTLLEKELEFELIHLKLDQGEQLKPDFLAINPFHHIPTLVDDNFNVIESLAILDYLDNKYPTPKMLPDNPQDLAIVRMVQATTANELAPTMMSLAPVILDLPVKDAEKITRAEEKVSIVLKFFENLLDDRDFFGSNTITLAEPVAGTIIPWLTKTNISLSDYPKLNAWCNRLLARKAWQLTKETPEAIADFKARLGGNR
ncbi:glutathione S-transferase domain protein [Chondrocystis sp. NIES-4102]|nr:glutathione S-transferase domain protein [Chondrocystis sp. NIES-4102]